MNSQSSKWLLALVLFGAGNLVVVALGFSQNSATQATKPSSDETFLPLEPGTYWVYAGTVTWADTESDSVQEVTTKVSITTRNRPARLISIPAATCNAPCNDAC